MLKIYKRQTLTDQYIMQRKNNFLVSTRKITQKNIPEMQERMLDVLQKHATSYLSSHMAIEAHSAHGTNI